MGPTCLLRIPSIDPTQGKKLCGTVYTVQSCNTCIGWVRLKAGSTKRFYIRGSCENEELVKGGMVGQENWPLSISRFSLALTCQKMPLLNKVIFKKMTYTKFQITTLMLLCVPMNKSFLYNFLQQNLTL